MPDFQLRQREKCNYLLAMSGISLQTYGRFIKSLLSGAFRTQIGFKKSSPFQNIRKFFPDML